MPNMQGARLRNRERKRPRAKTTEPGMNDFGGLPSVGGIGARHSYPPATGSRSEAEATEALPTDVPGLEQPESVNKGRKGATRKRTADEAQVVGLRRSSRLKRKAEVAPEGAELPHGANGDSLGERKRGKRGELPVQREASLQSQDDVELIGKGRGDRKGRAVKQSQRVKAGSRTRDGSLPEHMGYTSVSAKTRNQAHASEPTCQVGWAQPEGLLAVAQGQTLPVVKEDEQLDQGTTDPKLVDDDRGSQKETGVRKRRNEDVVSSIPQALPPEVAHTKDTDVGPNRQSVSEAPSSAARLAAALEGFSYRARSGDPPRRPAHSDGSSGGVQSRAALMRKSGANRSDASGPFHSPSKSGGSLSMGYAVASPSVSFEGGHSAISSAAGGSGPDQDGDSHGHPRKVSKRRERAALRVIAPGEKVRQTALTLIAEGKRVTADEIRKLIPEEAGKKGTQGQEGSKRPAGVVNPDWVPPVSPYGLIQEELWRTPWKLLVACLLLNVTSGGQMRRVIWNLFELIPTAEAAIAADTEAIGRVIYSLGLFNKRAVAIQRFSKEYLEHLKDPLAKPLDKVHGVGKYAADAHAIFCEGRWQEVVPHDHVLNRYWEWMWATQGEGAAFKREDGS